MQNMKDFTTGLSWSCGFATLTNRKWFEGDITIDSSDEIEI